LKHTLRALPLLFAGILRKRRDIAQKEWSGVARPVLDSEDPETVAVRQTCNQSRQTLSHCARCASSIDALTSTKMWTLRPNAQLAVDPACGQQSAMANAAAIGRINVLCFIASSPFLCFVVVSNLLLVEIHTSEYEQIFGRRPNIGEKSGRILKKGGI
jgi:hypothetical protein